MNDTEFREVPLSMVASLSGAEVDTLRLWLARNPTPFRGEKRGRNLWFNVREVYFYCLLKALIDYGINVATAMDVAAKLVGDVPADGLPKDAAVVLLYLGGDIHLYDKSALLDEVHWPRSCAVHHVGRMWHNIMRNLQGEDPAPAKPRRKRKANVKAAA